LQHPSTRKNKKSKKKFAGAGRFLRGRERTIVRVYARGKKNGSTGETNQTRAATGSGTRPVIPDHKLFVLFGPSRCDSRYHRQGKDRNDPCVDEE
jgi:hypothetical protein